MVEQKNRYDFNEKNAVAISIELDLNVSYLTQVKEVTRDPMDFKTYELAQEPFKYTFFDLLAEFGGFVCLFGSLIALFMGFWNYRSIQNSMISRLYKMRNAQSEEN